MSDTTNTARRAFCMAVLDAAAAHLQREAACQQLVDPPDALDFHLRTYPALLAALRALLPDEDACANIDGEHPHPWDDTDDYSRLNTVYTACLVLNAELAKLGKGASIGEVE